MLYVFALSSGQKIMKMNINKYALIVAVIAACTIIGHAQTTGFPFQGSFVDAGLPANGTYDLRFILYTDETGPVQVGNSFERLNYNVTGGTYSVNLDFGTMPFVTQELLWVHLAYRVSGSGSGYTYAAAREPLRPSPFALRANYATTAAFAQNADTLGGLYSVSFVQNNVSGTPQAGIAINVDGDVSGYNVNAVNAYHIGWKRGLSSPYYNLYAGIGAGTRSSSLAAGNAFFGTNAGTENVGGVQNSFFGTNAGNRNTSSFNSFFG